MLERRRIEIRVTWFSVTVLFKPERNRLRSEPCNQRHRDSVTNKFVLFLHNLISGYRVNLYKFFCQRSFLDKLNEKLLFEKSLTSNEKQTWLNSSFCIAGGKKYSPSIWRQLKPLKKQLEFNLLINFESSSPYQGCPVAWRLFHRLVWVKIFPSPTWLAKMPPKGSRAKSKLWMMLMPRLQIFWKST